MKTWYQINYEYFWSEKRQKLQILMEQSSIRMLSSLINYNAVLMMVVCDLRHLSFVA
jgi:hypothetical protein